MFVENVVLVDKNDQEIGVAEKFEAHLSGKLHRAISIFIFNQKGELLLQQRAFSKYHSGGLWTNTCCSHPRPGESTLDAAKRRLQEEMGFECELKKVFDFMYEVSLDHGLTEHEFDHVFIGRYDGVVKANPEEAHDWMWINPSLLITKLKTNPEQYTEWFKLIIERVLAINGTL